MPIKGIIVILNKSTLYLSYEAGRIKQYGNASKECGIVIVNAEHNDAGKWTCQVTANDKTNKPIVLRESVNVTVSGICITVF